MSKYKGPNRVSIAPDRLRCVADSISVPVGENRPHGTSVLRLLSQRSKRALGKAFDRKIVSER